MTESQRTSDERRVLILAPVGQDAALTRSFLAKAGIEGTICADMDSLMRELEAGAAAVLVTEEATNNGGHYLLVDLLKGQPPWSDLPILILTTPEADSTAVRTISAVGNVTVLERPVRLVALVSAVRTALRARQRQYEVRNYIADRERTQAVLHDADRRKDEFLAMLAHELRNPLAPIRNSLHILRLSGRPDDPNERVIAVIERQVNHLVRLVDDLLEISRITNGKIALRMERLELSAVLRSAVEASRPLIEAGHHQLDVNAPFAPIFVEGDPVRLAQVFSNLLNNAAKYTDEGGRIQLTVQPQGNEVAVSVRDSGTGISTDMLPQVFEMFTQLHAGSERAQGGLGIGLTLVKQLVEMHQGHVEARSEGPGKGSEFLVYLPVANVANIHDAERAAAATAAWVARRTLIVDDNRDAADSLGALLQLLGAEVCVTHSGPEALQAFDAYRPAVVLLDIGMPGMDGYEVARRMRQHPQLCDVTLIALTGWGQEADRRRAVEAGFNHHLTKPVDVSVLAALLTEAHPEPQ